VFADPPFPGAGQELDAALGGAERRFEHQLVRRDSGRRELEAYYRPHRGPGGKVLGVVTLLTDITERKRMEDRLAQRTRDLQRSNDELEQFAYVASHDLKAPLRGIENLVSWIEEDLEGTLIGDTRTNMDLVKSRVRRLESLLDDLLAYSRAGRGDSSIDRVDTAALVKELAVLTSPPEGFTVTGSQGLPVIETARAPLTQALQNLIGNAIKHHDRPDQGHIDVEARPLGDATEFTVTDDGPGIPEQFRDRVFGMFQTLRPRDEVEGSGMGLAIVKKLIERQGGRIWLTDAATGRGLAVHFTWPHRPRGVLDGTDRKFAAG
jgi:signal transduction histidine kinase